MYTLAFGLSRMEATILGKSTMSCDICGVFSAAAVSKKEREGQRHDADRITSDDLFLDTCSRAITLRQLCPSPGKST